MLMPRPTGNRRSAVPAGRNKACLNPTSDPSAPQTGVIRGVLITGIDGIRYAVRQHAVSVISDHDEAQDETQIVLHGGAVVRVPC